MKIGNIEITMELDETAHGKEIHIPKGLDSGASGEDFVMPEPTPVESAQPEASLQSFMSLGLVLDGERMNDMTSVRSYISGNNRYSGWEVSTDGNLYKNSLITDENAQVYVYTNEADLVTQLEFDNTYAKKNSLNLLIGGYRLDAKKEELTGKFGVPEKTISTQESDELHYYIGDDHAQEIVLMFYKETRQRTAVCRRSRFSATREALSGLKVKRRRETERRNSKRERRISTHWQH